MTIYICVDVNFNISYRKIVAAFGEFPTWCFSVPFPVVAFGGKSSEFPLGAMSSHELTGDNCSRRSERTEHIPRIPAGLLTHENRTRLLQGWPITRMPSTCFYTFVCLFCTFYSLRTEINTRTSDRNSKILSVFYRLIF